MPASTRKPFGDQHAGYSAYESLKGFRALYRRVPRLFDELRLARADGTYSRLLARIAKIDVLVLDDFAIAPLTDESRRDLLEIFGDDTVSARRSSPAS